MARDLQYFNVYSLFLRIKGISDAGRISEISSLALTTSHTPCVVHPSFNPMDLFCTIILKQVTNSISANRRPTNYILSHKHLIPIQDLGPSPNPKNTPFGGTRSFPSIKVCQLSYPFVSLGTRLSKREGLKI